MRPAEQIGSLGTVEISIHALTRSATEQGASRSIVDSISIHALTRSATAESGRLSQLEKAFQSTHSRGVRRSISVRTAAQHPDFNPRTHEECDTASAIVCFACWISIHALTRSATTQRKPKFTPATNFNPRTHEECDRSPLPFRAHYITFQSTHSRGVRRFSPHACLTTVQFQSTHSRGVRPFAYFSASVVLEFQSTHSRGVRPSSAISFPALANFNPRTHEECDARMFETFDIADGFQSTHSRGVRHAPQHWRRRKSSISIHALTRSAT